MKGSFFIASQKRPIHFLASHSCITQTIQSKHQLTSEELLVRAYKSNALDLKETYLSYSFFQSLTQEYHCFFSPKTTPHSAILDLLLPASFEGQICCIFLSAEKNYFCFYQDHALVFCREFKDDIKTSLQHIKLFFDHEISEIFCLCYPQMESSLSALSQTYNLIPLLSLFSPHLGFELSSIKSPIMLERFHDLNPPNQNTSYKNLKLASSIVGGFFMVFLTLASALWLYRSSLLNSFESLNQNISSSSFTSPIEEISYLRIQNQKHLASLAHFSSLNEQQLSSFAQILPLIPLDDFLSIQFNAPHTFLILFRERLNVTSLIATLNDLGYRCKFFKEQNSINLEISKI